MLQPPKRKKKRPTARMAAQGRKAAQKQAPAWDAQAGACGSMGVKKWA